MLVSVITPSYHCDPRLAQALASVQAQVLPAGVTLEHWVVFDDQQPALPAPSQRLAALLAPTARADRGHPTPTPPVPRHTARALATAVPGSGPSAARNLGLAQAQGEVLAFLDADDLWDQNRVATLLPLALRHGLACDRIRIEHAHRPGPSTGAVLPDVGWLDVRQSLDIDGAFFPLYRRDVLPKEGWDPELRFAEDLLFNFQAARAAGGLAVWHTPLMTYRVWPDSATHDMPRAAWRADRAYRRISAQLMAAGAPLDPLLAALAARLAAKRRLNRQYWRAWRQAPQLSFEAFLAGRGPAQDLPGA